MCFAIRDRKGSWEALPSIGERSIPTWPDLGQLCNSFYDRRLGCEFNREIVSLRLAHAHVRARAVWLPVEFDLKRENLPFPGFPCSLLPFRASLSPLRDSRGFANSFCGSKWNRSGMDVRFVKTKKSEHILQWCMKCTRCCSPRPQTFYPSSAGFIGSNIISPLDQRPLPADVHKAVESWIWLGRWVILGEVN